MATLSDAPRLTAVVVGPSTARTLKQAIVDFAEFYVGCSDEGIHRFEFWPAQQKQLIELLTAVRPCRGCRVERDGQVFDSRSLRMCHQQYGTIECRQKASGDWEQPFGCARLTHALKGKMDRPEAELNAIFRDSLAEACELNCGRLSVAAEKANFDWALRERKHTTWRVVTAELMTMIRRHGWPEFGGILLESGVALSENEFQALLNTRSGTCAVAGADFVSDWEELQAAWYWEHGSDGTFHKRWTVNSNRKFRQRYNGPDCFENIDRIRKAQEEFGKQATVAFMSAKQCCPICERLYNNESGVPRTFTVQQLRDNGTNYGRSLSDWRPTLFPGHLGCNCYVQPLGPGRYIDSSGRFAVDWTQFRLPEGVTGFTSISHGSNEPTVHRVYSVVDDERGRRMEMVAKFEEPPVLADESGGHSMTANDSTLSLRIGNERISLEDAEQVELSWKEFVASLKDREFGTDASYPLVSAISLLRSKYLFPYDPGQHTVSGAVLGHGASCQARTLLTVAMLDELPELIPDGWILGVQCFRDHVQPVLVPVDPDRHEVWDILTNNVMRQRVAPVYASSVCDRGLTTRFVNPTATPSTLTDVQPIRAMDVTIEAPAPVRTSVRSLHVRKPILRSQIWPAGIGEYSTEDSYVDADSDDFVIGPPTFVDEAPPSTTTGVNAMREPEDSRGRESNGTAVTDSEGGAERVHDIASGSEHLTAVTLGGANTTWAPGAGRPRPPDVPFMTMDEWHERYRTDPNWDFEAERIAYEERAADIELEWIDGLSPEEFDAYFQLTGPSTTTESAIQPLHPPLNKPPVVSKPEEPNSLKHRVQDPPAVNLPVTRADRLQLSMARAESPPRRTAVWNRLLWIWRKILNRK